MSRSQQKKTNTTGTQVDQLTGISREIVFGPPLPPDMLTPDIPPVLPPDDSPPTPPADPPTDPPTDPPPGGTAPVPPPPTNVVLKALITIEQDSIKKQTTTINSIEEQVRQTESTLSKNKITLAIANGIRENSQRSLTKHNAALIKSLDS